MRVLIVGGGAAGLCCAIRLRQLDPALQVTVLERLEQPGKKLLATGNGRCNLTNMQAPHSRAVLDFFASLGLMTRQEDLGRVYPYSLRAATVQNLLLDACRTLGVRLVTGCRVEKIIPGFTVQTDKGAFAGDKVVVACGICACTGGIFHDCYNVLGGVDKAIPVDVYVPGCAVRPEAIIDGVVQAIGILDEKAKAMAQQKKGA